MVKNLLISLMLFANPSDSQHETEENTSSFEDELYPFAPKGLKQSYRSSVVVFSTSEEEVLGSGSGNYFRYKNKKFIVTAAHVVDNEGTIYIGEKNIDVVKANLVYIDKEKDIAIIQPEEKLKGTKAIRFSPSRKTYIGEKTYHTGHPDGESWHLSDGLVSKVGSDFLILNTFAWPGSSGSVVFNRSGEIIGVISAIKISSPMGIPDMIEHIVIISSINNLNIEEILSSL
tara:strand:- start:411 stop:1100 length:690 start_codon:yes stop_codon:yes gene_type:complete